MIWRSYDPEEINAFINHPELKENGLINRKVDVSGFIHGNVWLLGEGFLALLIDRGNGLYEVHVSAIRSNRGLAAITMARKVINYMFKETDCQGIVGIVPSFNKAAIKFGQILGAKKISTIPYEYLRGKKMQCEILFLKKERK